MNISFEIPHDIGLQLTPNESDLTVKAREAFLVELYREHEITHRQLGEALGLERYETDGVLKKYGVGLDLSVEEIKATSGMLHAVSPA